MNASFRGTRRWNRLAILGIVAGWGWLGFSAPRISLAGAIHGQHRVMIEGRSPEFWNQYYTAALRHHWMRVRVPLALRGLNPGHDALIPDSPFMNYLEWRRNLNPTRFDRVHPLLGPLLEHHVSPGTVVPPVVCPHDPPPPVPPPPSSEVPEPSTGLIAAAMFGAGALARRWARAKS